MTTDILQEIWLPIAEYEGAYEVSNFGNVRSLDREINKLDRCGNPYCVQSKGRTLKKTMTRGYQQTYLCSKSKSSTYAVHRLVAKAFLGDRPDGYQVNHIDGDKTNNRTDNLEYCTPSQNIRHAHDNGLAINPKGSNHPCAKLSDADVLAIRKRLASGESGVAIAKDYRYISRRTISSIKTKSSWAHVL